MAGGKGPSTYPLSERVPVAPHPCVPNVLVARGVWRVDLYPLSPFLQAPKRACAAVILCVHLPCRKTFVRFFGKEKLPTPHPFSSPARAHRHGHGVLKQHEGVFTAPRQAATGRLRGRRGGEQRRGELARALTLERREEENDTPPTRRFLTRRF